MHVKNRILRKGRYFEVARRFPMQIAFLHAFRSTQTTRFSCKWRGRSLDKVVWLACLRVQQNYFHELRPYYYYYYRRMHPIYGKLEFGTYRSGKECCRFRRITTRIRLVGCKCQIVAACVQI